MKKLMGKFAGVGFAILVLFTLLFTLVMPNVRKLTMSEEDKLAMTYNEISENDYKTQSDNVKFVAYFARDLNGDGYAERLNGTAKNVTSTDTLYMEVNVITDGTLENGVITIGNNSSYKLSMNLPKDSVLKNNCISKDIKRIELNNIEAGTQKLLYGDISSYINRYEDYSKLNKIIFTGTHVASNGTRTEINKEIDLTIDWYGNTSTYISTESKYETKVWVPEEDIVDNQTITLNFKTAEETNRLLLKSRAYTVNIPSLCGYRPESITGANYDGTEANYSISNEIDEEGNISVNIPSSSNNLLKITYPNEAYKELYLRLKESNGNLSSISENLYFEINASYTGYNNPNFSESTSFADAVACVVVRLGANDIEPGPNSAPEVYAKGYILGKTYLTRDRKYILDKQPIYDVFEKTEDRIYKYTVSYGANNINNKGLELTKIKIDIPAFDKLGEENCGQNYALYIPNFNEQFGKNATATIYKKTTSNGQLGNWDEEGNLEVIGYITNKQDNNFGGNGTSEGFTETRPLDISSASGNMIEVEIVGENIKDIRNANVYVMKKIDFDLLPAWELSDLVEANSIVTDVAVSTEFESTGTKSKSNSENSEVVSLETIKSYSNITIENEQLNEEKGNINADIHITAGKDQSFDSQWQNGIFLVEIPSQVINMKVNSLTCDYDSVWNFEKIGEKHFIKIYTQTPITNNIGIVINADMFFDPTFIGNCQLKLYSYNELNNNYVNKIQDIYDINDNGNSIETVGNANTYMKAEEPTTLVTYQTVTEYNENDDITIAPNIAEITKNARSAKINVVAKNGYARSITGTKILGRVPYEGNKHILDNNKLMGSSYTANMKQGGITVPASIAANTTVYYSENETPSIEIENVSNGWKTAEQVTNWNTVKSYLIDLSSIELTHNSSYSFSYEVVVPENLEYNDTAFSTHAIYYEYNSPQGKLDLQTEPSKIGIKVSRTYDLELTKIKEATVRPVQGAVYKIIGRDGAGEIEVERTMKSNFEGKLSTGKLYVNAEYVLTEETSPVEYMKDNKEYKFKVVENNDLTLSVQMISEDTFASLPNMITSEEGQKLVATIEEEPKYEINIEYVTNIDETIKSAIVEIDGEMYVTDAEGKINLKYLTPGKDYELSEKSIPVAQLADYTFNLRKASKGNYTLDADAEIQVQSIVYDEAGKLIQVNVKITKETNPRYNLEIIKVEKDDTKTVLSQMKKLEGAKFSLQKVDDNIIVQDLVTDENGKIELDNLYQLSNSNTSITGKYRLKEEAAPDGYILNGEEVEFVVTKENENLRVDITNRDNLTFVKDVQIEGTTVKLIVQNVPYFKLTKVDSRTNEPLANVKFAIYELNQNVDGTYSKGDFAKDIYGNYVGTQNEEGIYEVVTDETGIIQLPLRDGKYQVEETKALDGYIGGHVENFELKNGSKTNSAITPVNPGQEELIVDLTVPEKTNTLTINHIEDLIEIANKVNSGETTYADTKVVLARDLDFNDPTSYRGSTSTEYGDYNEDEVTESIIEEMKKGKGFKSIGYYDSQSTYNSDTGTYTTTTTIRYFEGVFDGNNHEIRNMYVNNTSTGGLFGVLYNAVVENLGITGNITSSETGAICKYALGNVSVYNCYNKANISGYSAGGIIGRIYEDYSYLQHVGAVSGAEYDVKIVNCYNEGKISNNGCMGGIIGSIYVYNHSIDKLIIKDCYNKGDLEYTDGYDAGGIIGKIDFSSNSKFNDIEIFNCYNKGESIGAGLLGKLNISVDSESDVGIVNIRNCHNSGNAVRGGIVYEINSSSYPVEINIKNCYNEADLTRRGEALGGILSRIRCKSNENKKLTLENCYNTGEIKSNSHTGGLLGNSDYQVYVVLKNCYNEGHICSQTSSSGYYGGLVGYVCNNSNSVMEIENCYNTGKVEAAGSSAGGIQSYGSGAKLSIKNTYNTGDITYSTGNTRLTYIGGIVAYEKFSEVIIEDCYNTGNLKTSNYAGGIIGYTYGDSGKYNIKNCYNTGNITNDKNNNCYLGGIISSLIHNFSNSTQSAQSKIENCYNLGNLTYTGTGDYEIGGISGLSKINIENCYNKGEILAQNGNSSMYVGGIVGDDEQEGTIKNCINYGTISTKGNGDYTAGIAGKTYKNIDSCYNYGNMVVLGAENIGGIVGKHVGYDVVKITNSYNRGNIICGNAKYIGGIVGNYARSDSRNIETSYNTGNITVVANQNNSVPAVGGILGQGAYNIKNCYNEGNIIANGVIGGISGINTLENATISNVYNIGSIINNGDSKSSTIVGSDTYNESTKTYTLNKAYYQDDLRINGGKIIHEGTAKTWNELISNEFYNELNNDSVWIKRVNKAPTLNLKLPVIGEVTQIDLTNDKEEYVIATAVRGEVDGGTISGANEGIYETVNFGQDNTKEIDVQTNDNFELVSLSVNGDSIPFSLDENKSVRLRAGFFPRMAENKMVVATFAKAENILTIVKKDVDTDTTLAGAHIKIEQVIPGEDNKFIGVFETNEIGEIRETLEAGTYIITEVSAPEGYLLDTTPHTYELDGTSENNVLEMTNKAKGKVIVHYYLKQNDEYTTNKLTDDVIFKGNDGDEYVAELKRFEGLDIEKDVNGEYVIPENISGKIDETQDKEVNIYYEAQDITLTIHHYLEETDQKLAEDEEMTTKPEVTFDNEGKYEINKDYSYDLDTNTNYIALTQTQYLFGSVGTRGRILNIQENMNYDENTELTYSYGNTDYTISTSVNKHSETRMNGETGENEEVLVAGGTISGEGLAEYEKVTKGENATKDIVVKANEGYNISSVKLVSIDDENEITTKVIYGEGAEDCELTYVGTAQELTLSKFENVTANKRVIAQFEPIVLPREAMVKVHHRIEGQTEDYDTKELIGYVGDDYITQSITIPNYEVSRTVGNVTGTYSAQTTEVYYYYDKVDCKINIKYVDVNTNEEIDSTEIGGKHDNELDLATYAKEIDNYTLRESPAETTVRFTIEEQTYTYKYARNIKVRAIYVEEGTITELADPIEINGYVGKEYETSAKTITNYTLKAIPSNAEGTMRIIEGNTEILVTYEYKRIQEDTNAKVIEKYVDINSNEVVESIDHLGNIGDTYLITAKEIDGYVVLKEDEEENSLLPTNATGTMKAEVIEVIYKVASVAKVTVQYMDKEADVKIITDIVIDGYEGKTFVTEKKDLTGYEFVNVEGIASGMMNAGNQVVTYNYKKIAEPAEDAYVRVMYIDTDTKERIAEDTIIVGYEGKEYETSAKEIEDYELLLIPTKAKGIMEITEDAEGNKNNETLVKYIYRKRTPTKVVEKYIDINDNTIVEKIDHDGKIGDKYEIIPKEIKGYKLIEKDKDGKDIIPENKSGLMKEEPIEVIFYVAKDAKMKARYTVKYTDETINDETIIEGYEGKEYSVNSKDIDGYELIEVDGKQEGIMKAGDNIITFYYAKKATGIIPQTGIELTRNMIITTIFIGIANAIAVIIIKKKVK